MSIYHKKQLIAGGSSGSSITKIATEGNVVATVNQNGTTFNLMSGPVGGGGEYGYGSGTIYYDWSLIDGINYGCNLTAETSDSGTTVVNATRDCLFIPYRVWNDSQHWMKINDVMIPQRPNPYATIPTIPVTTNSSNATEFTLGAFCLRSGDVVKIYKAAGLNSAKLYYTLIPIKSYGGSSSSGSGVFIDFTKVNTVVTATLSSDATYEVPYDCKVAAQDGAAMYLLAEQNGNTYYIDMLENGLGCSIYVKKGTKLKATAIADHTSGVTFLPVS